MSLINLRKRVEHYLNSELSDFQFKQTLADDCTIYFATVPIKDWDKANLIAYCKKRYDILKSYCVSICKQEEIVDSLTDYHPKIESYLEKYKVDSKTLNGMKNLKELNAKHSGRETNSE